MVCKVPRAIADNSYKMHNLGHTTNLSVCGIKIFCIGTTLKFKQKLFHHFIKPQIRLCSGRVSATTHGLCDLGEASIPLWDSVFFLILSKGQAGDPWVPSDLNILTPLKSSSLFSQDS